MDNIFAIRTKIEEDNFFTISCLADERAGLLPPCVEHPQPPPAATPAAPHVPADHSYRCRHHRYWPRRQTNKESKNTLTIGSCELSEKAAEERELEGDHLVVACQLSRDSSFAISSHTLIDHSATGFAFMDKDFARRHQFPLIPLKKPRTLEVIDGRPIASGMITHLVCTKLQIRHHVEDTFFFVTRLGHYPLVLGIPWFRHHDVNIRFTFNKVTFDSEWCYTHHNAHGYPTLMKGLDFIPERPAPRNRMAFIGCAALLHLHRKNRLDIHSVSLRELNTTLKLASLSSKLKLATINDPHKDPNPCKDPNPRKDPDPHKDPDPCKDTDPRKDTKDPHLLVLEHFHEFLHIFEKGKA